MGPAGPRRRSRRCRVRGHGDYGDPDRGHGASERDISTVRVRGGRLPHGRGVRGARLRARVRFLRRRARPSHQGVLRDGRRRLLRNRGDGRADGGGGAGRAGTDHVRGRARSGRHRGSRDDGGSGDNCRSSDGGTHDRSAAGSHRRHARGGDADRDISTVRVPGDSLLDGRGMRGQGRRPEPLRLPVWRRPAKQGLLRPPRQALLRHGGNH
mmetsp:Transcript_24212/g.54113  ORF Transcript_24212/g.54113 Transcript_24212/m.54113 type:complete len:211 (+) Transcript_24212:500-1132(+)